MRRKEYSEQSMLLNFAVVNKDDGMGPTQAGALSEQRLAGGRNGPNV
jgi:hypothetical protein